MDITIISDTHGLHNELSLKAWELLIHAGDITEYGTEEEVIDFLQWFSKQSFLYKIFIAGNHDLFLEECPAVKLKKLIPNNTIYLQNSGVEIDGHKIYGSPVTPYFLGMAFNEKTGKDIQNVWKKIPFDTDILITHGPPKGILDNDVGCEYLLDRVNTVQPAIHCFGHAHEQKQIEIENKIRFVNAALVNSLDPIKNTGYKLIDSPVYLELW